MLLRAGTANEIEEWLHRRASKQQGDKPRELSEKWQPLLLHKQVTELQGLTSHLQNSKLKKTFKKASQTYEGKSEGLDHFGFV